MSVMFGVESWQLEPITFEPKLNYNDYLLWFFKIEIMLKSHGLWHPVNAHEVPLPDVPARKHWEIRDTCAWLQFLVNIQGRWLWIFKPATTAHEI